MKRLDIILAEHDAAMRGWLVDVLQPLCGTIEVAGSGWELLLLLADEKPCDLVISDVRIPLPGGLHSLAMARAAGVTTPFLVITAHADDAVRGLAKCLRAELLDTPFDARQLAARIDEIVAAKIPLESASGLRG
ncbi:MAG: response regulator [Acidobacteriota bacterium]